MNNTYYTQEALQQRREKINKQLLQSKKNISHHWQSLTSPTKADTQVQQWVNQAEKAVAIYDGFMLMYKLMHRFNSISNLFKRKNKVKK